METAKLAEKGEKGMTALAWRKELPDRPGWWWLRRRQNHEDRAIWLAIAIPGAGLHMGVCEGNNRWKHTPVGYFENWDFEWAGSIPVPEEEKK